MNIGKIIAGTTNPAKKIIQNIPNEKVDNIITKASALFDSEPDYLAEIPKNSHFQKYSKGLQKRILNFKETCWFAAATNDNKNLYTQNNNYLNLLITHCDDEKIIHSILQNFQYFSIYKQNASNLFKSFKKICSTSIENRNSVISNLSIMKMFNSKSFKSLWKSKGIEEIKNGKLNISYLKDVKPFDKIDDNFFYKLFDNIEQKTNQRLSNAGIDLKAANEYIKLADEEICLKPHKLEEFISKLEKINNPELANNILNKFKMNENFFIYHNKYFTNILEKAITNPDSVEKALKLQKTNPYGTVNIIEIFQSPEKCKISDDLFDFYLKFEQEHPEKCSHMTFTSLNSFLGINGADEQLAKKIFEIADNKSSSIDISKIFYNTNKDNFDFVKNCIETNNITNRTLFQISLTSKNPELLSNFENLNKIYDETYLPLVEMLSKNSKNYEEICYDAERLSKMKIDNPKAFQTLEDTKILDLVKEGKINSRILSYYSEESEIMPEILSDIQKILNNESIIKHFDSTKNILKRTSAGDVVSVQNKLYINNNGKLEPWNMTEEKFNELFPLVDRFSNQQGIQDCYLVTVLNSLYQNPRTRGLYYKLFEQKENDIYVTIPAYKDFGGSIKFPNGEIKLNPNSANASKHIQMLEQAYGRTSLRKDNFFKISTSENPLTTDNLKFLQERIRGGHEKDVINELLPEEHLQGKFISYSVDNKEEIEKIIKNLGQNPRYIIHENHLFQGNTGHAISIKSYNPETDTVTIMDPEIPALQRKESLQDLLTFVWNIVVTRIK